jgi:hypothetical protein
MQVRHPFLVSAASAIILGVVLRAATPVEPLPPREPPWRQAAPDPATDPGFSAETYAAGSWGGYAGSPGQHPRWEPVRYPETRFDPLPPIRGADYTAYDEPPRFDAPEPALPPAEDITHPDDVALDEAGDEPVIVLPPPGRAATPADRPARTDAVAAPLVGEGA